MTRIVAISDTHSFHRKIVIPDGDILVCAGDISFRGELSIIQDFADLLSELPHKEKLIIFGNHELNTQAPGIHRDTAIGMIRDSGATYLQDSGCIINGLNVWGSPFQPTFNDWEYNLPRNGQELFDKWQQIPLETNLLITHSMPFGILDWTARAGSQGCELLTERIKYLSNLKAFFGGHLHFDGGKLVEKRGIIFGNAAICTDNYKPTNSPLVIDI